MIRELVYEPEPPVLASQGVDSGVDPDLGF